jgi:hypothetical protein
MAKKLGDNLTTSIDRAGWSKVEALIDRSGTPTWTTLQPASSGAFREEPVHDRGLDGTIDVHFYRQKLTLHYLQTDLETMQDIFAPVILAQLQTTGVPVRLWRLDGVTVFNIPLMRFLITPDGDGYTSALRLIMEGESTTLESIFTPEPPPAP